MWRRERHPRNRKYITHRNAARQEDRATATGNIRTKLVKLCRWFSSFASGQTKQQTYRQTDIHVLITKLRTLPEGEVTMPVSLLLHWLKLKFHGSSLLLASSWQYREDVRNKSCVSCSWNLENNTRDTDRRAALHGSRPLAHQSGKRVASWTVKSPDIFERILVRMSGVSARTSRGCYEETALV